MPVHLRPTAAIAADAILVGDPGRALMLAQELLEEPKMSNHARGLWGYSGATPAGHRLTIQSTGIGGPSAALVLGDLAELGLRRAVRVGTCAGFAGRCRIGELLTASEAMAEGGSAVAHGIEAGEAARPDAALTERLRKEVASAGRAAVIASFDVHPAEQPPPEGAVAADMQSAALLGRANALGLEVAALLVVAEIAGQDERLEGEALELAEKLAGRAASSILSA